MKIQYCSDLHLEMNPNRRYFEKYPFQVHGDILILAGDTTELGPNAFNTPFFDHVSRAFRMVLVLPGNHEFYGGTDLFPYCQPIKEFVRPNVLLLNNTTFSYGGITFVFTTLWSHINMANSLLISRNLSDFKFISYDRLPLTVDAYNHCHRRAVRFLDQALDRHHGEELVIVTHHLPSTLCNAEEYKNSQLNEAFCTELHDMVYASGARYWLYGHSHRNVGEVRINGTQLLSNQLGYVASGEHHSFRPDACLVY